MVKTINSFFFIIFNACISYGGVSTRSPVLKITFFGLFLGWGNGQVIPLATSLAINIFPTRAGTASASIGTGSMLAGAIVSLLFGIWYDGTPISMSILMITTSLAALVFCFLLFYIKKKEYNNV